MEPIISKLQEGVKYPRFERDATTIINDLVEHITKERGVYSSSIEPNPSEHKVWFNTNDNTLNIYENGKWNTISGQGGGTISGGIITGATIDGGYLTGTINASGATINGATISGGTLIGSIIGSGTTTIDMKYGVIKDVCINGCIMQNNINATNATISGATINGATISYGYLTGSITASGATINGGNIHGATLGAINVTSGSINYANISNAYINYSTLTGTINASGATINGATISGGNINVNQIKASGIETPYIRLTSGSDYESIHLIKDNYIFNGKLADSTLFHSIDLNHGSIAGLTSIKTLSHTGLSIEPYDVTGTGTPIIINGRAAGINIIADSTAHLDIECITKLNWIKGSSVGYMMTFNTSNNTINSNYDTFNITNGNIKLTSGLISGNTNVDLTLSGTISGGTISGATISGGTITGIINASGATIDGGYLTGTINANGATINGGNINGATISGATIGTGNALLYAGSKVLVTYTGSVANPILIPSGGRIGYDSASLTLCGVTLTGGDFTKLKNLQ